MVRYQGEKMSKSLGNLIWARDLLQTHTADAVRVLVNGHPYHETWEYDVAELDPADALAARLLRGATIRGGNGKPVPADAAGASSRPL
jgi:L-cysteine:1D-myo-inositol 2-amino-2-deoxy-alpha-D-glucopyranoside ligase